MHLLYTGFRLCLPGTCSALLRARGLYGSAKCSDRCHGPGLLTSVSPLTLSLILSHTHSLVVTVCRHLSRFRLCPPTPGTGMYLILDPFTFVLLKSGSHAAEPAPSTPKEAHDWAVDQIADLFRTTHKVKTQQLSKGRGQRLIDRCVYWHSNI